MKIHFQVYFSLFYLLILGCNGNTSMTGHSDRVSVPTIAAEKKTDDISVQPETAKPTVTSIIPDFVVAGEEVYKDCKKCIARASELAPKANFTADINQTCNLWYYKIEPSQGLCDIHFVKSKYDIIQSHEGHDSVLSRQIALYCPCNCGWAYSDCRN